MYGSNYIHPADGDSIFLRNSDNHQTVYTGETEMTELRKKTKQGAVRSLNDKSEKEVQQIESNSRPHCRNETAINGG